MNVKVMQYNRQYQVKKIYFIYLKFFIHMLIEIHFFHRMFKVVKIIEKSVKSKMYKCA